MKIVFVTAGLGFGGAERVVSVLANEFVKNNNVRIILTSGNNQIAYDLDKRIDVQIISKEYGNFRRWCRFRRLCKEYNADIVLAFMDTVGVMSSTFLAFSGIPVIVSERNDPSEKSRQKNLPMKILSCFSKYLTSGYVFQSEGAKSYYSKRAQKKSCIILNPLDIDKFPTRDDDREENRVVTVGRLHEQKNQKLLIEAFVESEFYKDCTLHIYGDGGLREELKKKICDLNACEKIFLEGNVKDVHEKIKNAKLFVFTSDYEGLPNALMEAMAMGIPCISTDCSPGGARMLINSGVNGMLVPCRNKTSLVKVMNDMCRNNEQRRTLGKNAVGIRKKTNIEEISKQWLEFIYKVIGEKHD